MKTFTAVLFSMTLSFAPLNAKDSNLKEEKVVNVYGEYGQIPESLIRQFEHETGIKVNLDYYDANEVLEAKLLAGNTGYDIVFPTVWPYFVRQSASGLYQEIDQSQLPNYKNLDPIFIDKMQPADPKNRFAVPFTWGLVAIGYNEEKIKKIVPKDKQNSWSLLYDPEVLALLKEHGVTLLQDPLDVFLTYYIYRGEDPLNPSLKKLKEISKEIKKIRPYIKRFSNNLVAEQLYNGELAIVMHWAGILANAASRFQKLPKTPQKKRAKIKIMLPKEGTLMWIDCIAIPQDAPHVLNAHRFINFLLKAESAAAITNTVYTPTTVKASYPLLRKDIRNNKSIFPEKVYFKKVILAEVKSLQFQRRLARALASFITHKE